MPQGDSLTVDNRTYNITINSQTTTDAIEKTFKALNRDKAIDSLEIHDKKKNKLLSVSRSEFRSVAKEIPIAEDQVRREIVRETLVVFKVVFGENYKWEVMRGGQKISVAIEDQNLFRRIDQGEQFGKGHRLDVDLEITKVLDQTLHEFIIKSYVIKKVHSHSRPDRTEQIPLT
jgi:hypothetical protein